MSTLTLLSLLAIFFLSFANSYPFDVKTIAKQGKGFYITGILQLGTSADGIGDFNGDGIDDIIVSAESSNESAGEVYVIFGKRSHRPTLLLDKGLTPSQGFAILGSKPKDYIGSYVTGIGDINGDGYADILVSAKGINDEAGAAYVIYGTRKPLTTIFPVDGLDPSQGFAILGSSPNEGLGCAASRAGDINGDGIDDFIIGAEGDNNKTGAVYVIFGKKKERFSTITHPKISNLLKDSRFLGMAKMLKRLEMP